MALTGHLLWLRAETFIHVGAGATASLIDLPFAREAATDYPYIPGSAMKGALRDAARLWRARADDDHVDVLDLFGHQDNPDQEATSKAGRVLVSDARLALLPLRSMQAAYVLATCPQLLDRVARDRRLATGVDPLAGQQKPWAGLPAGKALFAAGFGTHVFVEEYRFPRNGDLQLQTSCRTSLSKLFDGAPEKDAAIERTVVLADVDFGHFARRGLHVRMRNALEAETKTVKSGHLWSEESLPPETIMTWALVPRAPVHAGSVKSGIDGILAATNSYLQVGGNETVGEGWFSLDVR